MFGFDYDYTLAEYTPSTLNFIFEKAKYYLVEKHGYPPEVLGIPYDPDFIIRGLFFDPKRGVMMKLDGYSGGFFLIGTGQSGSSNETVPFKIQLKRQFLVWDLTNCFFRLNFKRYP